MDLFMYILVVNNDHPLIAPDRSIGADSDFLSLFDTDRVESISEWECSNNGTLQVNHHCTILTNLCTGPSQIVYHLRLVGNAEVVHTQTSDIHTF